MAYFVLMCYGHSTRALIDFTYPPWWADIPENAWAGAERIEPRSGERARPLKVRSHPVFFFY